MSNTSFRRGTDADDLGSTDSERLFCHLLDELADHPDNFLAQPAGWKWLHVVRRRGVRWTDNRRGL